MNEEVEQILEDRARAYMAKTTQAEPVAWMIKLWSPELGEYFDYKASLAQVPRDSRDWTPLYAAPQPARRPLDRWQFADILARERMQWTKSQPLFEFEFGEAIVRAVERAHAIGEKK